MAENLGEDGASETVFAATEIDDKKQRGADRTVGDELRGERLADVGDGGEGGDDQRGRGGDAFGRAGGGVGPDGGHAHAVLADGDGDAEGRAELHAHGLDGGVEVGSIAGHGGGGHPVGGEVDLAEVADLGGGEVGQGFADGEAGGGGGTVDRDGRAFAHGHGLAGEGVVAGGGHGAIGHGHLPGADHLVAADQAGDGAIADGDEEGLVGDGGVREHAADGLGEGGAAEIKRGYRAREGLVGPVHAGRFAQQHVEGEVDGAVVEMGVVENEALLLGGFADDGEGAAFAFAEGGEGGEPGGRDGEDVALLGLVAPDGERRHAGLVVGQGAKVEATAATAIVDQFGQGVGNAAGADVVDEGDGVLVAEGPAAVDDLLTAAFHLGVVALHGGEIEVLGAGAAGHGGGRAAAESDQHAGPAEDDQLVAGEDLALLDVAFADVAEATGEHDGFVVTA